MVFASVALMAQGRGGRAGAAAQPPLDLPADTSHVAPLKDAAVGEVDRLKDFSQQMVDQIFSDGELGFSGVRDVALARRGPQAERLHPTADAGHPRSPVLRAQGPGPSARL